MRRYVENLKYVYYQGIDAFVNGKNVNTCPYENIFDTYDYIYSSAIKWSTWMDGYKHAMNCNTKVINGL